MNVDLELKTGGKKYEFPGKLCEHITAEAQYYVMLFGHYQNGYLEQAGGVIDQSTRYLGAMRIIGRVHNEWEQGRTNDGH